MASFLVMPEVKHISPRMSRVGNYIEIHPVNQLREVNVAVFFVGVGLFACGKESLFPLVLIPTNRIWPTDLLRGKTVF